MAQADAIKVTPQDLRVLVVDDDPDSRDLMALILEKEGLHVSRAGDGREFLAAFSGDESSYPDVVVSDIRMPDIDGATAFEVLQRARCRTPFVFVSGMDDRDLAPFLRKLRGAMLLRKPFDAEALVAAVLDAAHGGGVRQ